MPLSVRFESVISRALEREVHVSNLQILGEMAREVTIARITMMYTVQQSEAIVICSSEVFFSNTFLHRSVLRGRRNLWLCWSSTLASDLSHTGVGSLKTNHDHCIVI